MRERAMRHAPKPNYAQTISRATSLVVALGYVIASVQLRGRATMELFAIGLVVAWPRAFIWFPKYFGNYTGYWRMQHIDTPTPPILIAIAGWCFLIGMPILLHFVRSAV